MRNRNGETGDKARDNSVLDNELFDVFPGISANLFQQFINVNTRIYLSVTFTFNLPYARMPGVVNSLVYSLWSRFARLKTIARLIPFR